MEPFTYLQSRICHTLFTFSIDQVSKKNVPSDKYDTIAPNLEINENHFRDIDPDVHADLRYKNSIDRSRNV